MSLYRHKTWRIKSSPEPSPKISRLWRDKKAAAVNKECSSQASSFPWLSKTCSFHAPPRASLSYTARALSASVSPRSVAFSTAHRLFGLKYSSLFHLSFRKPEQSQHQKTFAFSERLSSDFSDSCCLMTIYYLLLSTI